MWDDEDDPYIDRTMRKFVLEKLNDPDLYVWGENLEVVMKIAGSRGYCVREDTSLDTNLLYFEGVITSKGVYYSWKDVEEELWCDHEGNPLWPVDEPGHWSPETTMRIRERHGQLRLPFAKRVLKEVASNSKNEFEIDFSILRSNG
jgi:hypothetical protein